MTKKPSKQERIARQCQRLGLAPWEFAPLEVDYGPVPYSPGTAGHESWKQAVVLKRRWAALRAAGTPDPLDCD